jgi:hypothetical protein
MTFCDRQGNNLALTGGNLDGEPLVAAIGEPWQIPLKGLLA